VPTVRASRELLASPEDVWSYLSEPYHLSDWWPRIATVEPDRRGFAAGARWRVRSSEPTYFRRAASEDILLVQEARPMSIFAFELVKAKLKAELLLEQTGPAVTSAELSVSGPWLFGFSRSLPKHALDRLHDLCQAGVEI
jgi:Polyketide cyclase / dehydrase and lipid transport